MKLILSLDGGGIRGIAMVAFLAHLEKACGPLHEIFDMFIGISIGSFIAACLANKITCADIMKIYDKQTADKIFYKSYIDSIVGVIQFIPEYDGKYKTQILHEYFKDITMGQSHKHLIIPTYNTIKRRAKFFKSFREKDQTTKCADIVDAASAAIGYFPSVTIDKRNLIDAGILVNDPSMCAYADARALWPNEEIRIISIGTGLNETSLPCTKNWGLLKWASNISSVIMDQTFVDYQTKMLLGEKYIRINSSMQFGATDQMDNTSQANLQALIKMGDEWWKTHGDSVLALIH